MEELRCVLRKYHNWKTPRSDLIHNLYLNCLTEVHQHFVASLTDAIQNPEQNYYPDDRRKNVTSTKTEVTKNSKNYRRITCLNTNNIRTLIRTERIYSFLEQNSIRSKLKKVVKRIALINYTKFLRRIG